MLVLTVRGDEKSRWKTENTEVTLGLDAGDEGARGYSDEASVLARVPEQVALTVTKLHGHRREH